MDFRSGKKVIMVDSIMQANIRSCDYGSVVDVKETNEGDQEVGGVEEKQRDQIHTIGEARSVTYRGCFLSPQSLI